MIKRSKNKISRRDADLAYKYNQKNPFINMPPGLLAKFAHDYYNAVLDQEVDVEGMNLPPEKIQIKYVSKHLMFTLEDDDTWKALVNDEIYPIELNDYTYERFYYDKKWVEKTYDELVKLKHKKRTPFDREFVLQDLVTTLEKLYKANDLESAIFYAKLTVEHSIDCGSCVAFFPTNHEYAMEMLSELIQQGYKTSECNALLKKIIATHGLSVKDVTQEYEVSSSVTGEEVKALMVSVN